jgi:DNA adenine methylase
VESLQVLNGRGIAFIVSYDGRTEQKSFGKLLPSSLGLGHIEIDAGRSSQATLLGRTARTYESLYLSPALTARLNEGPTENPVARQLSLF